MIRAIGKRWRDSASLIVVARRPTGLSSSGSNYDILLQTRTVDASFSKGVVFPGGVSEEADASDHWLQLLSSFGFSHTDYEALHQPGTPLTPIFASDPIRRHIALRITAIRETFEELGLLFCSTDPKGSKRDKWTNIISDIDIKYWRPRVNKDPSELLRLCKEHNCYPDIWNLHYWSNWLSPLVLPKRFDTAFFLAVLENKPESINANSEVVKVEWSSPAETLERNLKDELLLYPPQGYELLRFAQLSDFEELTDFAIKRSCRGDDHYYPIRVHAVDGLVYLLPGDYLYPTNVDPVATPNIDVNKTILQLRDSDKSLNRIEAKREDNKENIVIVTHNYTPEHHLNMGNKIIPINIKIHDF